MSKYKLLDLFCGAGGASMGYHRAGFEVVGVDINPQPHYPFEFHQADALTYPLEGFDAYHASPPCQAFTIAGNLARAQGKQASKINLIPPTRERLTSTGKSYVIENVPKAPLLNPVIICGSSFGLMVRRHRIFESNVAFSRTVCRHKEQGRPIGVYHVMNDNIPKGGKTATNLKEAQGAMGIDWMTWNEIKEAIPPAYTEYIGKYLMKYLTTTT